jgi:hypothetical protein
MMLSLEGFKMKKTKIMKKMFGKCFDKRALSPVISTMIMASVVIALCFVVLGWANIRTQDFAEDYGDATDAEIARLGERLSVEYVAYDGTGVLQIYLLNYGDIDLRIENVRVKNDVNFDEYLAIEEMGFQNGSVSQDPYLPIGEGGYLKIQCGVLSEGDYDITMLTERRSSFVSEFEV